MPTQGAEPEYRAMEKRQTINQRIPARHMRHLMCDDRIQLAWLPIAPYRRKQNRRTHHSHSYRDRKKFSLCQTRQALRPHGLGIFRDERQRLGVANSGRSMVQPQTENQSKPKTKQEAQRNYEIGCSE